MKEKGYTIIERNFHVPTGEIDIIVLKCQTLAFVEVKTLPNGSPEMLAAVLNSRKQEKIIKTAKCYLQKHRQYSNKIIRFDVVVVGLAGFESVHLIENAFSEN